MTEVGVGVQAGTTLGPVAELVPGEGRAYAVDGAAVAVFLLADGTLRAVDAVCPHRGGPLADGQVDGSKLVCPLHAYAYDLDTGACTSEGIDPVGVHAVDVVDGWVRLRRPRA